MLHEIMHSIFLNTEKVSGCVCFFLDIDTFVFVLCCFILSKLTRSLRIFLKTNLVAFLWYFQFKKHLRNFALSFQPIIPLLPQTEPWWVVDLNRTKIWFYRSSWIKVTPNLVPDSQYKLLFSVPRMACKLIPRVLKKNFTLTHSKSNPSFFHIKSIVKCKQFWIKVSESTFGTKKMAIELMWRLKKKYRKLGIGSIWKNCRCYWCEKIGSCIVEALCFLGHTDNFWANSPAKFSSSMSVS